MYEKVKFVILITRLEDNIKCVCFPSVKRSDRSYVGPENIE